VRGHGFRRAGRLVGVGSVHVVANVKLSGKRHSVETDVQRAVAVYEPVQRFFRCDGVGLIQWAVETDASDTNR